MDPQGIGILLLILTAWIVLNRWVLPRFGIDTCMSCSCRADRSRPAPDAEPTESTGDES